MINNKPVENVLIKSYIFKELHLFSIFLSWLLQSCILTYKLVEVPEEQGQQEEPYWWLDLPASRQLKMSMSFEIPDL